MIGGVGIGMNNCNLTQGDNEGFVVDISKVAHINWKYRSYIQSCRHRVCFVYENRLSTYIIWLNKLRCESLEIVCNNDHFFREHLNIQLIALLVCEYFVQRVTLYHHTRQPYIKVKNLSSILGDTFSIMLNLHPSVSSLEIQLCSLISYTVIPRQYRLQRMVQCFL